MWYASPAGACGTAIARLSGLFFLNASACFWSDAHVFGTLASRVFTTRPTFSSATGDPYRRLTAVPYENASSAYFGNCLRVAFFGEERQDEAVGSELPGPVVRADDDVRSGGGRHRLELVADVAEVLLDHFHGHAAA